MSSESGFAGDTGGLPSGDPSSPFPHHRYNTRSRERSTDTRQRHATGPKQYPQPINTLAAKQIALSSHRHANHVSAPTQNESSQMDTEDDPGANDVMMLDHVMYQPTSNPLRAPFPSPAIKSSQGFYPFPPTQGFPLSGEKQEMGWNGASGNGGTGSCILVEAANRAQMAILVDDMGGMGIATNGTDLD